MDTISSTTTRLIPPQVHSNLSTTTRFRMELRAPSKSGYARSLYLANILSSPVEQAAVARRMKKECASLWPAAQVLQVNNKAHVSDYDKAADATNNDHLHRLAMLKSAGSYVRKAQGILKSRPLTQGLDSRYLKYCVVPSKPLLSSQQRSDIMATDPHHAIISNVISAGPTYLESGAVVKDMTKPLCSLSPASEFLCGSATSSSGGLLSLLTLGSKSDKSDTQLMARDSAPSSQMDLPCVIQHNEGHHFVDHGVPSSSNASTARRRALVKYEPQTSISNEKSNSGVTGFRSTGLPHEGSVKVNAAAVAEGKTKTAAVNVKGSNKAVQFSTPMSSDDVSCEIKQDRFLLLHSSTNALTSLGSSSSSSHGSRSRSRHWSNPGHSGMIVPGGSRPKSWHDDDSNRAILNDDVQIRIMVADEGDIEGMRRAASPLSPAAGQQQQQQQASSLLSFKTAMKGRLDYMKESIVRTKAGSTNDVTLNSDVRMGLPVDMVCKGGLESNNNPAGLSGRACTDVQHHLKNRNAMMSASVKIAADRCSSGPQSKPQPQSPRGRPQVLLIPPSSSGQALSVMSVRRRVSERLVCLYKSLQASIGRKQQQQQQLESSDTQQQ